MDLSKESPQIYSCCQCWNEWTDDLEHGGQIDVIYTDFEKAFDKVPHQHFLDIVYVTIFL